jgi:DNA (cytosine-5)-methyltransferase 1
VRLAVECHAPFFFWENVAGAIGVVPSVATHLHASGYTAIVWCVLRARDVGAPHERARVFLLAYSERFALRQQPGWRGGKDWACPAQSGLAGADVAVGDSHRCGGPPAGVGVAHPEGLGWLERGTESAREQGGFDAAQRGGSAHPGVGLANPERQGLEERRTFGGDSSAELAPAQRRGLGLFPPGRDDRDAWARVLAIRPELAPARAQPRFRGLAHGLGAGMDVCVCPREDRLRATGNGVVRQQAERAWRLLWTAICQRVIGGQQP